MVETTDQMNCPCPAPALNCVGVFFCTFCWEFGFELRYIGVSETTNNTKEKTMKTWKTYPMGAAEAERMELRGLTAYLDHAVLEPCDDQAKALCGVKTFSLCMDSSQSTTEIPDCPRCAKKLAKL